MGKLLNVKVFLPFGANKSQKGLKPEDANNISKSLVQQVFKLQIFRHRSLCLN